MNQMLLMINFGRNQLIHLFHVLVKIQKKKYKPGKKNMIKWVIKNKDPMLKKHQKILMKLWIKFLK